MSESSPNGPFDISHWLNQGLGMSVGGDDIGDDITLGETNQLTGGESGNATIVQNSANVNMAFAARNLAGESDVVGVYGGSDGSRGISIGVAGACDAGCGVAGVATAASVTALPSSVGVFGAGDFHGVYGVSGALASQQPDLKTLSFSGETVAVAGANGTVDQRGNGGTARAPAVLGLNGISADDIKKTNFHAAAGDVVTEASGVEGIGVNGMGVVGISFAPGTDPDTQDLPIIDPTVGQHLNGPIADPLSPILNVKAEPAGVVGLGLGFDPDPASPEGFGFGSPGVRGISAFDRGGIFQSATGITHLEGGGTQAAPPIAQIRLVPINVGQNRSRSPRTSDPPTITPITPALPKTGHIGDLFAVVGLNVDNAPIPCSLWFCVHTGGIPREPAPAQWAQVALFDGVGQLVAGSL
jgi:hypothetical protein